MNEEKNISEIQENDGIELHNQEIIEVNKKLDELTEILTEKEKQELIDLETISEEQMKLILEYEQAQENQILEFNESMEIYQLEHVQQEEYQSMVLESLDYIAELEIQSINNNIEIYSSSLVIVGLFIGLILTKFFIGGFSE